MKNYAYLMFTDANANHNKFYEIMQNDDSSIDVNYGRVGATVSTHHYSSYEKDFFDLKRQKEYKGYVDVTLLRTKSDKNSSATEYDDFEKIENKRVDDFLRLMFERQLKMVNANYTTPTDVTDRMISRARSLIAELENYEKIGYATWQFNDKLKDLFNVIPRKMGNVYDYIAHKMADYSDIIDRENTLVDALENVYLQKQQQQPATADPKHKQNIAEANNLKVTPVTYKQEDEVIRKLKDDKNNQNRYLRAVAVVNNKTQKAFEDFVSGTYGIHKQTELLWHGSPNKNWWSIATNGLDLKHSKNGMFGQGLYFAPKSSKSAGCMSTGSYWRGGNDSSGYLALFEVNVGRPYTPCDSNSWTKKEAVDKLHNLGHCDSVWAKEGNNKGFHLCNDEVIVYRNEQQTVRYLVEISNRNRNFMLDITKDYFKKNAVMEMEHIQDGISCNVEGQTYEIVDNVLSINGGKPFSGDDMWFIARELKKQFFESEEAYSEYLSETKIGDKKTKNVSVSQSKANFVEEDLMEMEL